MAASRDGRACSRFLWASAANSCVSSLFFLATTSMRRNDLEALSRLVLSSARRLFRASISPVSWAICGSLSEISRASLSM